MVTTQWWIQTFRWGSGRGGGDHPGPDIEGGVPTKTNEWWIQTFRWGSGGGSGDHPGPDIEGGGSSQKQPSGGSRPSDEEWGGGGRPSRPWHRGGGASSRKNFSALRASFWSKNKGVLPWIRHCNLVPRPLFLENWRSDPTSGLPFSKGKAMAKRLGMMPGCIKCYFLCLFPEPGSNWSTEKPRIHDYLKTDFI